MAQYTHSTLLVLVAACLVVSFASATDRCAMDCGVPQDIGTFCKPMDWSVCQTEPTWKAQAAVAEATFNEIVNASGFTPATISKACATQLASLQCAKAFPACEIADEVKRVCPAECNKVADVCHGLDANLICSASGGKLAAESNCFDLGYQGPAVGMWLAGFLISVLFSFLAALGINLQKHSMALNELAVVKRTTLRQPLWMTGFILIFLGSILDFVAFGLAPQTFLAPLAALSLVWNIVLAPRFHKEKVTCRNLTATVVIFVGVTSTVIFSTHVTPTYQLDDLLFLYTQPVFIAYAFLVVIFLGSMYATTRYLESEERTGGCLATNGLVHILCYGGLGGTFGGQSVMLAKSTVELVKSAVFENGDAFTKFPTYVIAISMAITLMCQISFLNAGLARFDALKMVPTYQAFWIVSSILGGEMYFEEYTDLNALQAIMFVLGTLITVGGIAILLSRSGSDEDEKDVCKCCSDIPCCYIGGWNALRADSVCSESGMELVDHNGTVRRQRRSSSDLMLHEKDSNPTDGSDDDDEGGGPTRAVGMAAAQRRHRRHRSSNRRASTGSAGSFNSWSGGDSEDDNDDDDDADVNMAEIGVGTDDVDMSVAQQSGAVIASGGAARRTRPRGDTDTLALVEQGGASPGSDY